MPSTYLFLNNLQKEVANNRITWNNLPTLSTSTRECYISIIYMDIVFTQAITSDEVLVKVNLPNTNYYSSNNDAPVMRHLVTVDQLVFVPSLEASIQLLSNDNLKRVEVQLFNSSGSVIANAITSMNVTLKIDYVVQEQLSEQFILEMPKHL